MILFFLRTNGTIKQKYNKNSHVFFQRYYSQSVLITIICTADDTLELPLDVAYNLYLQNCYAVMKSMCFRRKMCNFLVIFCFKN